MSIFDVLSQIAGGFHSGVGEETGLWSKPLKGGVKTKTPFGRVTQPTPTPWQKVGQALGGYTGRYLRSQVGDLSSISPRTSLTPSAKSKLEELLEKISGRG